MSHKPLTFETKCAIFSAIDRCLGAEVKRVDFLERGATVRPRKNHIVVWWAEDTTFYGELYTPDAQFVSKFVVSI